MLRRSLLPLLLFTLACAKPATPPDTAAVRAAIQARNDAFVAAFVRGDTTGLAEAYLEDAVVMRPRQTDLHGRAAAVADLEAGIRSRTDTVLRAAITTGPVDVAGDLAFEVGTGVFEHRPKNDPNATVIVSRTKYITFWQKGADGAWRVRRDLTVADTAAAPH